MGDDKNLIFGIIIGAIIVILFMGKPKPQAAGPNKDAKKLLGGWRRLKRIPNTERIMSGMETAEELPSTYYEQMVPKVGREHAVHNAEALAVECQETGRTVRYKNNDVFEIVRDPDTHRILRYKAVRDAKITKS